jgi:hypothetical protein
LFVALSCNASADCLDPNSVGPGLEATDFSTQSVGDEPNVGAYRWNSTTRQWVLAATYIISDLPPLPAINDAGANGDGATSPQRVRREGRDSDFSVLNCDDSGDEPKLPTTFVTAIAPSGIRTWLFVVPRIYTWGVGVSTNLGTTSCQQALAAFDHLQCDGTERVGAPNGCGSTGGDVPDHFVGMPAAGNVFTSSCNAHDQCYSRVFATRQQCDVALGNAMRVVCAQIFDPDAVAWATTPPAEVYELQSGCNLQAQVYETALVSAMDSFKAWMQKRGIVGAIVADYLPSSIEAFDAAQHDAKCERAKTQRRNSCGF